MNITSIRRGKGFCIFVTISVLFSLQQARAACSLTPIRQTNTVGAIRSVTANVTSNSVPVEGVIVGFAIISGPNTGTNGGMTTDAGGNATFSYPGNGGVGSDTIRAIGTVDAEIFSCLATQVWISAAVPPTIQCPDNVVATNDGNGCSTSVAFPPPILGGSPMPTARCRIGNDVITSPHSFPVGTTVVSCTASNVNGTNICSFTVTVTESIPPEIVCPADLFATAPLGASETEVIFDSPFVTDNCGTPTVACVPASGSLFPVGVTPVTCTATDNAGNTNICSFFVTVEETQPETHDLAVVKIKAPRFVNLNAGSLTKRIVVTIQNRSAHAETIDDPARFAGLVTLAVQSFDTNACPDITAVFLEGAPQRRLPFILKPKGKLNVYFNVTFDCAVNPSKGLGQEDFFYFAKVNHEAVDDLPDTHPECDVCPRPPLDGGVDPNPDGRIKDKGCGAARGDGTFGNDVLTDVFVR